MSGSKVQPAENTEGADERVNASPDTNIGWVQSSSVFAISAFALSRGLPQDVVEGCIGTSLASIMDGTKRIRADAPPRLCMALLARNPSLAIPIALGRSLMPTFGNEVAHTAQFAPTVGHALAMHARYSAILVKQGKWTLSQSKSFVNFRWSHPESKLDGGIMDATIVAFNWRLLSEATGRKLKPREVYLSSDEIGAPGVYTDYFQSKVVFNAGTESAGLILRKSDLDQAVLMGDYPLFKQCCRMLDVRLECLFERDEKRLQILREVVRTNLAMGDRRFTAIARMLGVSLRTAQREATRCGTTLRALVDEEVFARAQELLHEEPRRSMDSIAVALGYSDERAFRRAFQRMSGGETPSAFRKRGHASASIVRSAVD